MGQQPRPPPLPELEWNTVPSDHSYVSKRVANCNWLQSLEGAIDNSHSNFLHAAVVGLGRPGGSLFERAVGPRSAAHEYTQRVSYPRFETLNVEAGVLIANQRPAEPGTSYWRVNAFLMPFYTQFPSRGAGPPFSGH